MGRQLYMPKEITGNLEFQTWRQHTGFQESREKKDFQTNKNKSSSTSRLTQREILEGDRCNPSKPPERKILASFGRSYTGRCVAVPGVTETRQSQKQD